MIQNFHGVTDVHHASQGATQTIPGGPVASQEAIKELGTNGGGFFNANSAHPFENPTRLTNFLEICSILLIPFALTFTFGRMVEGQAAGLAVVFAVMVVLWLGAGGRCAMSLETDGNPQARRARASTQTVTATQPGGNMEGKEVRFGAGRLRPVRRRRRPAPRTAPSTAMHDSFTPLGGAGRRWST